MIGCIYHEADLDGVMSAAIVKKYFKGDIDLLPYNYGKEIPDVKVIIYHFTPKDEK
jgi:oligoribonuclease NrnB/cAMP/cGMP phosphodiesterase (DHH superfamily)